MATPAFVSAAGSNSTGSPRTVTMPSSLAVGNRVVAEVTVFSTTAFTWPSGWNALVASNYISNNGRTEIRYYDITDSSALSALGSSISVTTGTGVGSHIVTQISGVDFGTAPEGAANTPGNPAPDPPSLNPAGWATEETFWQACLSHRNNSTGFVTAAPSGYTNLTQDNKNDDATFGLGQASCSKVATAASDDPAAFSTIIGTFQVAFTIAHRPTPLIPITVDADDKSKTYAASDPSLTASITSGSLRGGDTLNITSITRAAGENATTYTITINTLTITDGSAVDVTALYDVTKTTGTFTINKYAITVTADAQGKTYGASDPSPLSWQTTSGTLQGSDTFTGVLARAAGEPAAAYAINVGTLAISDGNSGNNYTLTFVPADFTITTRAITITAANKSKLVDDADPALTASVTSGALQFSDALSGALTRAAGETAGTYAITQGTLTVTSSPHAGNAANYAITFVPGVLTISEPASGGSKVSLGISLGLGL